jgi:hypothetical protein
MGMFDIQQNVANEYGKRDEGRLEAYIDGLMEEFAASPEANTLLDAGVRLGWSATLIEYGVTYCGVTPPIMSVLDFREVVFELFPRKVSTEAESASDIVTELRAFWQFVQRQYGLRNASQILAELDGAAVEILRHELADPANYGLAKSFIMRGMQAGYDMTTQQGLDEFLRVYNRQLAEGGGPALPGPFSGDHWPGLPLVNPPTSAQREDRRKARKRQRQARKRNRR